jgi:hypothetical protein
MDSQTPEDEINGGVDASNDIIADEADDEEYEEYEVTREELVDALQEVVVNLSEGLQGADRDAYLDADDLAQNDWFYAGVSDEPGMYAVTMWRAEGEEHELRVDIGTADDVHQLAGNPDEVAAIVDDFIEAMSEDFDEDYDEDEEDEEDEEEDLEEFEEEDDDEGDEYQEVDEEDIDDDEGIRQNGNRTPR